MIKNVIFDFDGVIRKINEIPLEDILHDYGITKYKVSRYRGQTLKDFFKNPLLIHIFEAWDLGFSDLDFLIKQSALLLDEDEKTIGAIYHAVIDPKYNTAFPETVELIYKLKKEGYKLYILSNLSTHVRDMASKIIDFSLFEGTAFSCDVKMVKPNLDYYIYFVKRYKVEPEESIFIDDNKDNLKNFFLMNGNIFLFRYREIEKSVAELYHLIHEIV